MKKILYFVLFMFLPISVWADPAAFVGVSYSWGGNLGISVKVLSDDEEDNAVVAAGATYYPMAAVGNKFGLDVGAGYAFDSSAIIGGWDFLQNKPLLSFGYADVDDDSNNNSPTPAPAPDN
jgi:hypothetical protein